MLRRSFHFFLLVLALAALPFAASAQEKGQLPYATVNSYLELFRSLEHLDLIIPSMMIFSTDPKVSPSSIELKVLTDDGWQNFSPDENGVVSLPENPDWHDHNLITNQPRGTLQLVIGFKAKPLTSATMPYQELMGLVPQFDEALAALASQQGQPAPGKVKGLTIQMSEGSGATVTVQGKRPLKSNSAGMLIMKYNEAQWQQNPQVDFSEIPVGIVPLQ